MLYTTTRSNRDAYTVHRVLCEDTAQDGGRYVPLRFPQYDIEALTAMCGKPVNDNIAEILNTFFSTRLSGWDIDFCIGRNAVRLKSMTYKISIAELWHNTGAEFDFALKSLYRKVLQDCETDRPTEWFSIAVRIALYFAIYCEQCRTEQIALGDTIDISVTNDNGISLMAACYARKMGLPIGTIICSCVDSASLWDLIHRGEVVSNGMDDATQVTIERFLEHVCGFDAVSDWLEAIEEKRIYNIPLDEEDPQDFGVYCVVVGAKRADQTINSIFRSNGYLVDPYSAVSFAGLQDYRTKSTAGRLALVFAENSPQKFSEKIAAVTGIQTENIAENIDI